MQELDWLGRAGGDTSLPARTQINRGVLAERMCIGCAPATGNEVDRMLGETERGARSESERSASLGVGVLQPGLGSQTNRQRRQAMRRLKRREAKKSIANPMARRPALAGSGTELGLYRAKASSTAIGLSDPKKSW